MKSRGFTLIEVMVATAIMAIIMAALAPSLREWVVNVRIRNTADGLMQGVQLARQEAIRRNQTVSLWLVSTSSSDPSTLNDSCALSNASGSWVVAVKSPAGKCSEEPSVTPTSKMIVAKHAAGDSSRGVTVTAVGADGSSSASVLTFDGLGRTTANPDSSTVLARIDVQSSASADSYRKLRVVVLGVGAVRLCDSALSGNPEACPN